MARLLIIEDDVSLRENLVRMLQLKGHECLCCESFTNAAAEALTAAPDCILLDLSLPGAYGHEICRAIRQESNVPIIVLTSSDSEFDEVMSMNVGADDYVVKPYRPAALLPASTVLSPAAGLPIRRTGKSIMAAFPSTACGPWFRIAASAWSSRATSF